MCAPVFKCFPSILGFKKVKKQSALDEFGTSTKMVGAVLGGRSGLEVGKQRETGAYHTEA